MPAEQQQKIAISVQSLLTRFNIDEDLNDMKGARVELDARQKDASECETGPSHLNPLGNLFNNC